MSKDINEIQSLIKRKRSIIEKLRSKIVEIFKFKNNNTKKYSTQIVNPEIFALNFPQYANISKEEMEKLKQAREEELKERRELEKKYGMTYDELLEQFRMGLKDGNMNQENSLESVNLEKFKPKQSVIHSKENYDEVIKKLNSKEITEEDLSISDLLKINSMLREEITIKTQKISKQANITNEIKKLEEENRRMIEELKKLGDTSLDEEASDEDEY